MLYISSKMNHFTGFRSNIDHAVSLKQPFGPQVFCSVTFSPNQGSLSRHRVSFLKDGGAKPHCSCLKLWTKSESISHCLWEPRVSIKSRFAIHGISLHAKHHELPLSFKTPSRARFFTPPSCHRPSSCHPRRPHRLPGASSPTSRPPRAGPWVPPGACPLWGRRRR